MFQLQSYENLTHKNAQLQNYKVAQKLQSCTEHTLLVLTVTINCRIILLMMLFITSLCKSLKTDPSREICTYAT